MLIISEGQGGVSSIPLEAAQATNQGDTSPRWATAPAPASGATPGIHHQRREHPPDLNGSAGEPPQPTRTVSSG
ncbi:hypothetical protein ACWD3J_45325 [Streptomyces sp. NPDC002755]|uniref:hypothetical protein n=1 Tax=Streptomyces sp. NPDC002884 TaxID=3154544 RepID=UPI003326FBFE